MSPIPMTIQLSILAVLRSQFSVRTWTGWLGLRTQKPKAGLGRPSRSILSTDYFLGAIASLAALATRNFTTVLALIWMGSPVCGLRPTRALRCAFTRRPRPGTTNTPFFLVSLIAVSARFSKNADAVLLLVSSFSARWRTSCVLVIPDAMNPPQLDNGFAAMCAILYHLSCGKTASKPHFMRFFMLQVSK